MKIIRGVWLLAVLLFTMLPPSEAATSMKWTTVDNIVKGSENVVHIPPGQWHDSHISLAVTFNVKLDDCPPGFYIDKEGNESVCRCSSYKESKSYRGVVKCDDNQGELVAYLRSQYWAGYQTNTSKHLITGNCPENYCNTSDSGLIPLPSIASKEHLDSLLCGAKHRTGKLCGECMDGYHIYVNSPTFDCGKCDDPLS